MSNAPLFHNDVIFCGLRFAGSQHILCEGIPLRSFGASVYSSLLSHRKKTWTKWKRTAAKTNMDKRDVGYMCVQELLPKVLCGEV